MTNIYKYYAYITSSFILVYNRSPTYAVNLSKEFPEKYSNNDVNSIHTQTLLCIGNSFFKNAMQTETMQIEIIISIRNH